MIPPTSETRNIQELSPPLRALLSLLLFGCFYTSLNLYPQSGYFAESLAEFDHLPFPLAGAWRDRLLWSDYWTHGMMYALGLLSLAGAFLPLLHPHRWQAARALLAISLIWKTFLLWADFRLWSTNEVIQLVAAGLMVIDPQTCLARVRATLIVLLTGSAINDLYHQGPQFFSILQLLALALWSLVTRWRGLGFGVMAILLFYDGIADASYHTVVLFPMLLLSWDDQPVFPRPSPAHALLGLFLAALTVTMVPHGLFILSPNRVPIEVDLRLKKKDLHYHIRIVYPRSSDNNLNDYRVGIFRFRTAVNDSDSRAEQLLEPLRDQGVVVLGLGLFNQCPECLREPYLYEYYRQELQRRWQPEQLSVEASWGGIPFYQCHDGN